MAKIMVEEKNGYYNILIYKTLHNYKSVSYFQHTNFCFTSPFASSYFLK